MDSLPQNATEMAEIVAAAKRQQTIAGLLVAGIVHAVLIGLLALIVLPQMEKEPPAMILAAAPRHEEAPPEQKSLSKIRHPQRPSAPSSAAAKVITAAATAPIAVPTIEDPLDTALLGVGLNDGTGFGYGLGMGGAGAGLGSTFFGNKAEGGHVAFVVDVSASMSAEQFRLMKDELTRSLNGLAPGTNYQVIFFSGPVWYAHQKVTRESRNRSIVHGHRGKKLVWESPDGKANGFVFSDGKKKLPVEPWITARPSNIRKTIKQVEAVTKSFGTSWRQPLRMALSMDPKPEVIYFMTDGAVNNADEEVKEVSSANRRGGKKAKIFTTAMMEPRAAQQLYELARKNAGTFSKVSADGSVVTGRDALK